MLEFVLIDKAVTKPFVCVACGDHNGPFARTFQERWGEEIYICESCTRRAARVHGLVKGLRATQLAQAAKQLQVKDAELAEILEREAGVVSDLVQERERNAVLEAELGEARGKVAQWEHLVDGVKERLGDATAPVALR
jgi:hypothetical protein